MNAGMYLINEDDQLVEMSERPYNSEALLQKLLATHPSLLAGNQINSTAPRRWLLIAREAPLPSEQDGANRWSVDHLFLDQDAIPTIVEVKRSSDTRIRREVVGQMLDYAANGEFTGLSRRSGPCSRAIARLKARTLKPLCRTSWLTTPIRKTSGSRSKPICRRAGCG